MHHFKAFSEIADNIIKGKRIKVIHINQQMSLQIGIINILKIDLKVDNLCFLWKSNRDFYLLQSVSPLYLYSRERF